MSENSDIIPNQNNKPKGLICFGMYSGYNKEDGLILNSSAIEKGLFRAQALKKYYETIKKNSESKS